MRMPFARMASTCAGHCSMKVTSSPARAKSAPNAAPFAPVPTTAIRLSFDAAGFASLAKFIGPPNDDWLLVSVHKRTGSPDKAFARRVEDERPLRVELQPNAIPGGIPARRKPRYHIAVADRDQGEIVGAGRLDHIDAR